MEVKELKLLFDSGALNKATVCRNLMGGGYMVIFKGKGNDHVLSGQRTNGEGRVFKTIDAAVQNVNKIGFQEITIRLQ